MINESSFRLISAISNPLHSDTRIPVFSIRVIIAKSRYFVFSAYFFWRSDICSEPFWIVYNIERTSSEFILTIFLSFLIRGKGAKSIGFFLICSCRSIYLYIPRNGAIRRAIPRLEFS